MSVERRDFDDLDVSTIRGRWQVPALTWTTRVLVVAAAIGVLLPGDAGRAVQGTVVGLAIAVPLVRVAWLVHRWRQERDTRFVVLGLVLLAVVGLGALFAAL